MTTNTSTHARYIATLERLMSKANEPTTKAPIMQHRRTTVLTWEESKRMRRTFGL